MKAPAFTTNFYYPLMSDHNPQIVGVVHPVVVRIGLANKP